MASLNETSVGSIRTRSKVTASMPSARRALRVFRTGSLRARLGSVTTMTRPAPSRLISWPTSEVTPGPNLMLEVSMEKAVSRSMGFTALSEQVRVAAFACVQLRPRAAKPGG